MSISWLSISMKYQFDYDYFGGFKIVLWIGKQRIDWYRTSIKLLILLPKWFYQNRFFTYWNIDSIFSVRFCCSYLSILFFAFHSISNNWALVVRVLLIPSLRHKSLRNDTLHWNKFKCNLLFCLFLFHTWIETFREERMRIKKCTSKNIPWISYKSETKLWLLSFICKQSIYCEVAIIRLNFILSFCHCIYRLHMQSFQYLCLFKRNYAEISIKFAFGFHAILLLPLETFIRAQMIINSLFLCYISLKFLYMITGVWVKTWLRLYFLL